MSKNCAGAIALVALLSLLAGCRGGGGDNDNPFAARPSFLLAEPTRIDYDGVSAGLVTGSAKDLPSLIAFAAPAGDPTPATLRTLQIQSSYFGLIDLSPGGGFGTYFGKLDARANKGSEYIAVSDDRTGRQNVTMVVQRSTAAPTAQRTSTTTRSPMPITPTRW